MGTYHFGTREVSGQTPPSLNPALVVPATTSGERKQPVQQWKRPGRKQNVNFSRVIRWLSSYGRE